MSRGPQCNFISPAADKTRVLATLTGSLLRCWTPVAWIVWLQVVYCAGARTDLLVDQKQVAEVGVQIVAGAFQVCEAAPKKQQQMIEGFSPATLLQSCAVHHDRQPAIPPIIKLGQLPRFLRADWNTLLHPGP